MRKYLPLLALILLVVFVLSCASSNTLNAKSGQFNPKDYGRVDPEKWEKANVGTDWLSPVLVYIGHRTTELTQPLMPDDTIIHVKSTEGFLERGWVKVFSESINYTSKTKNTLEGCIRSGEQKQPRNTGSIVAMLERGYYQHGDVFKQEIRFHLGNSEKECEDRLQVTTWPDETAAYMPLKLKLLDLNSVVLISNIAEDKFIKATSYDAENNQIWVEGLKSDTTRKLIIRYQGYADTMMYYISATQSQHPYEDYSLAPEGFEDWITFSETNHLLQAEETREFDMNFIVPEGAMVKSQRWTFWVNIVEGTQGTASRAKAVVFLVNMAR